MTKSIAKNITILFSISLLFSCNNSNTTTADDVKETSFISLVKPDDCTEFMKSLDFSSICLNLDNITFNENITTANACNLDLGTQELNGGELDVSFYFETDPNAKEEFQQITEVQKTSIPGSTYQIVNGIGDEAFIVNIEEIELKNMVITISNLRIIIVAQLNDSVEHCMFNDNQLIALAKAIEEKI